MASFLKYLASAAVFTSFAVGHPSTSSSTTLFPRDAQLRDEAVYLVECNYYSGEKRGLDGTRDYWVYVSDDIKFRSSDKRGEATVLSAPATDHQNHDGFLYHMDWTDGTADYPLGTPFDGSHGFSVWGLRPSRELVPGDGTVDGSEFHLLPGWRSVDAATWLDSHKMACYGENYTLPNDVINYGECVARYACYREDRWVLRTTLHVYDNTINVAKCGDRNVIPGDPPSLPSPSDVFANVKEAMEKNQGNSVGYDIGNTGCKIHFKYTTTNAPNDKFADPNLAKHVADLMQKVAAGPVGETQMTFDGECIDDFVVQGLICAPCNAMTYPKEGFLSREVSDLKSRGSDNGIWLDISMVEFMVECDAQCSGDTGLWNFIKKASTAGSVAAGFFEGATALGAWATALGEAAGKAPSC
jgi:hypothetical protein